MSETATPSAQRTITLPATVLPAGYTLRWPTKAPADELDYSLDLTDWLIEGDDDIATYQAVVAPYAGDATDLACGDVTRNGGVITCWLLGGTPNREHAVTVSITTTKERSLNITVWILVQHVTLNTRVPGVPVVVGTQGRRGTTGARGSDMLTGNGEPPAELGRDHDRYIDQVTGLVWEKQGEAWVNTGRSIADAALMRLAEQPVITDPAGSDLIPAVRNGQLGAVEVDALSATAAAAGAEAGAVAGDILSDAHPDAEELTGDELFPSRQDDENRRASGKLVLRLMSSKRAGLVFDTVAQAIDRVADLNLKVGETFRTNACLEANDGGGAVHQRVAAQPSHPGRMQDLAGNWYELKVPFFRFEHFFAVADGSDDTAAILAAFGRSQATGLEVRPYARRYGYTNLPIQRPVEGSVYPLRVIGVPGGDDGSFSVLKRVAGGDPAYGMATDGWVNNDPRYFGGLFIKDLTIDGSNIAEQGFVSTVSASYVERLNVINTLSRGIRTALSTRNGTPLQGAISQPKWYDCRVKNCGGIGFEIDEPTTAHASDGEIRDLNVSECDGLLFDIKSCAGFEIALRAFNFRRSAPTSQTSMGRIRPGKSTRIRNGVYGGDGVSAGVYNLWIEQGFYPTQIEGNSIDGAGAGVIVTSSQANGNGLVTFVNNFFVRKGDGNGGTLGEPKIVHGMADSDLRIESVNNTFQLDATQLPYAWVPGNTAGRIFVRGDKLQDSAGLTTVFDGEQAPGAWQTKVGGTKVLFASDGDTFRIVPSTPQEILQNAPMTGPKKIVLPVPVDGMEYTIERGKDATGYFPLDVVLNDEVTVAASLRTPRLQYVLKYSKQFNAWRFVRTSYRRIDGYFNLTGAADVVMSDLVTPWDFVRNSQMSGPQRVFLTPTPFEGDRFSLTRTAAAIGAFPLSFVTAGGTPIVSLNGPSTWVEVGYDEQMPGFFILRASP